jgi:hypothetical protein
MQYDLTLITVRPGAHMKVQPGIEAWLMANKGQGEFLACWYSEIGALNQILLLHSYTDPAALTADRDAQARSADAFGAAEYATSITRDTYETFPVIGPMKPGAHGPVYEVRTYQLRPASLTPTIEAWKVAVPDRLKLSPMVAAMYTLSGPSPRFVHIWPYPSLDERARIRAKAIETGVWPPKGGPDHLYTQQTDIFLPAAFSPMR